MGWPVLNWSRNFERVSVCFLWAFRVILPGALAELRELKCEFTISIGSLAKGVTRVEGFLEGEDAMNTVAAFREMGVTIVGPDSGKLTIYGVGMQGLKAPRAPLYMGNSGTALRLLAGLLAAQPFESRLTGDESLSARPMKLSANPIG